MLHELPHLPLDRDIPLSVLKRRGAISFSSSSVLFSSRPRLEVSLQTRPTKLQYRLYRRGSSHMRCYSTVSYNLGSLA